MPLADLNSSSLPQNPRSPLSHALDPLGSGIRSLTGQSLNKFYDPLGLGLFGKDEPQSTFAADTRAQLAREDYGDWLRTFAPIEDDLINQYDNPALRARAIAGSMTMANQGLASARESQARRLKGLGIVLTPEQQASQDRKFDIARGLAQVNAANITGRRIDDRDKQILTGMAPQGAALRSAQGG